MESRMNAPPVSPRRPRGAAGRALGLIAAATLAGAGCGEPAAVERAPASPPASDLPAAIARGGRAFRQACAPCHGERGDGRGFRAATFDPAPADLTRGAYKARSTAAGALPLDRDIFDTITVGVPGAMPSFEGLFSLEARMDIVQFVKTLSPRFARETIDPGSVLEIPPRPAATAGSLETGAGIYRKRCASCHGREGRGDGPGGGALRDDRGRPSRPADLARRPFRWGGEGEDIYRTVFTGLDGTPMRSYALSVDDDERWPLVLYVESLRRPPGFLERVLFETR